MVARRKTPKDERELPPAARDNPYAMMSREELDGALAEIDASLAVLREGDPKEPKLKEQRNLVSQGYAWLMVREGKAEWSGGKPKGLNPPVEVTPGPFVSDLIHENRR